MPFPANIAPIVFSIQNDTRYLRNAKNKWKNVTDPQKIQSWGVFPVLLN